MESLKKTFDYLQKEYPHIPLLLDGKRGDIGNTNQGTIEFAFKYLGAHGITLYPLMGQEALSSFLNLKDKGLFFLCRTSNSGAEEFFDLPFSGSHRLLYEQIGLTISEKWNQNRNCYLVLGGTHMDSLKRVREITNHMIALVPGIGHQGGQIASFQNLSESLSKNPLIFHSSRSIIYASKERDFAQKSRQAALEMVHEIQKLGDGLW
ncbi:MAG: orotidine-5'-phosphate decarboxylase [Planctomycetota bacterium]|nr:MAG: orotidine-5'-phosphate decarboxylase [Planctomycetota bacterium]